MTSSVQPDQINFNSLTDVCAKKKEAVLQSQGAHTWSARRSSPTPPWDIEEEGEPRQALPVGLATSTRGNVLSTQSWPAVLLLCFTPPEPSADASAMEALHTAHSGSKFKTSSEIQEKILTPEADGL